MPMSASRARTRERAVADGALHPANRRAGGADGVMRRAEPLPRAAGRPSRRAEPGLTEPRSSRERHRELSCARRVEEGDRQGQPGR